MGAKFDVSQAPEVARWLEKGFEKAGERAMVATAARLVAHIQNEIIPNLEPPPVDRGLYRAGWRHKAVKGGAEVYNSTPHAPFIEHGVRAENVKVGRRMIDALAAWVLRKGIAGKGRGAKAEARQIAWAIAMKMKERGIFARGKGFRVLEKAVAHVGRFLDEEFKREVAREFRE